MRTVVLFHLNMNSFTETEADIVIYHFVMLILFSIGQRHEIILGSLSLLINLTVGRNTFYNRPILLEDFARAVIFSLIYLVCFTMFSMLTIVVGEVNKKLQEKTV